MTTLYSEIRGSITTGDLVAWNKPGFKSATGMLLLLYQKILKAKYTHVAVTAVLGGRIMIIEATPPAVRIFPLSMLEDFDLVKTEIADIPNHLDVLLTQLGKPYSIMDFFRGLLHISGGNSDYYCSKLASKYYNDIGYIDNEFAGLTPDSIVEKICKRTSSSPITVKIDRGNLNGV